MNQYVLLLKGKIAKKGFSLVELSVVLTIIGVTIAGAIDLAIRKTEADRIEETEARMDTIEEALQVFLINNARLPCPADAELDLSDTNAGKEGTPSDAGALGVCASSNFNTAGGNIYSGTVPTKTLGISDKNMADDWDRRFTYVVDARFANNYTTNNDCTTSVCFKQAVTGGITVNETVANSSVERASDAIYALISHGKNGYGAYKYVGNATRLSASSDTDEQDNAGDDKSSTFDAVFVQSDTTTVFDDIVRYSTKELLIDSVNGITDGTTCIAADDGSVPLNATATTTDPCGTGNTACYALAELVNTLCLQP